MAVSSELSGSDLPTVTPVDLWHRKFGHMEKSAPELDVVGTDRPG